MSILNVNTLQPVGSGQTITVTAANITASSSTITANSFVGSVSNTSGTTVVAAGTTAAPSISPSGDSNTGILFPSADTIAFAEGGVEAARIDSSGRLLIGTTVQTYSSSEKLEVNGGYAAFINPSSTVAPIYVYNTDTTLSTNQPFITLSDSAGNRGAIGVNYSDTALWIHGQSGIRFRGSGTSPGTTEWARFDNSGNVGINSTSPGRKLDVVDSGVSGGVIRSRVTTNNGGYLAYEALNSSGTSVFSVTHNGRINLSENIVFASGQGIDFSATANSSGTMSSELLNDYEEGTWTPSTTGNDVPWSQQVGIYTKIGNLVSLSFWLQASGTSSGSGTFSITGIPYVVKTSGFRPAAAARVYGLQNFTGKTGVIAWSTNGTNEIVVVATANGVSEATSLNKNIFTNGAEIHFTFTYQTN